MAEYKPKSFEEKQKEAAEKQAATDKRLADLRLTTYNWMKNDAAIQQYLQQFNVNSQESFMQQYAHCKSLFMEYADMYASLTEQREEGNIEDAQERLMDIQLKKLFDIILQWDAKQINLEGIVCSWDLYKWQHNLSECPFITPVTQQEFDLYMQYANSAAFEYNRHLDLFEIDDERDYNETYLPEWFLFENLHTGNDKFLLLPHLRTEKENFYRGLCGKTEREERKAKYASGELQKPIIDTRPMAPGYYYRGIEDFVKRFENKEALRRFYKFYEYNTNQLIRDNEEEEEHGGLNEQVQDAIFHLSDVREKIPVSAQSDWRLAVIEALHNYNRKQVRMGLPYAYDDYCTRLDNGMRFLIDEEQFKQMENLADNVRNQILKGRELNGEPCNFDY